MDLDQPNSQMKGREELQDVIKRHEVSPFLLAGERAVPDIVFEALKE
jgi:hypothetical protein